MDVRREEELMRFDAVAKKLKNPVQYIFFSATYEPAISEKISTIVTDANQIVLKVEQLKLDNV